MARVLVVACADSAGTAVRAAVHFAFKHKLGSIDVLVAPTATQVAAVKDALQAGAAHEIELGELFRMHGGSALVASRDLLRRWADAIEVLGLARAEVAGERARVFSGALAAFATAEAAVPSGFGNVRSVSPADPASPVDVGAGGSGGMLTCWSAACADSALAAFLGRTAGGAHIGASTVHVFTGVTEGSRAARSLRQMLVAAGLSPESAWALEQRGAIGHPLADAGAETAAAIELVPAPAPVSWWSSPDARAWLGALPTASLPAYVYDEATLVARVNALKALTHDGTVDRLYFAIKANSNPRLLTELRRLGIAFECVSLGEIALIDSLFPSAVADGDVLFTPNFAARAEYEAAVARGLVVTVDNGYCLEHWSRVFAGAKVMLRVDPGIGRGHHEFVKTAGRVSKFGIPIEQLPDVARWVREAGVHVVGLHAHTGSGIDAEATWAENARLLASLAREHFPDVRTLDVGGGLPIPYRPHERPLDLDSVHASLARVKADVPEFRLWMEPGRFFVAECGALVASVTQLKDKGEGMRYLGVNVGMNALIRPALYHAYHEVANLSRDGPTAQFNVVGPICESGDTVAFARALPADSAPGDLIVISCAGAYGAAMSSNYNLRGAVPELWRPRE